MRKRYLVLGTAATMAVMLALVNQKLTGAAQQYVEHDRNHPLPPVVTPGQCSIQDQPGTPPADAIVLFNGKDLSNWESVEGAGASKWEVGDGYFQTVPKTGDI